MPTRFFIALLPPIAIQDYANQVIAELRDRYRMSTAKADPHITLQAPFEWPIDRITEVAAGLQEFAQTQAIVPIQLSGFSCFAPRVLYINVVRTPELMTLQAELAAFLAARFQIIDSKSQQRSFTPHLTVASRHMTRQSFQQAWDELQPRSVQFEFVSDRLTLLIHNGQRWLERSVFALGSEQ